MDHEIDTPRWEINTHSPIIEQVISKYKIKLKYGGFFRLARNSCRQAPTSDINHRRHKSAGKCRNQKTPESERQKTKTDTPESEPPELEPEIARRNKNQKSNREREARREREAHRNGREAESQPPALRIGKEKLAGKEWSPDRERIASPDQKRSRGEPPKEELRRKIEAEPPDRERSRGELPDFLCRRRRLLSRERASFAARVFQRSDYLMFKSRDELVEWTQNTAYSLGYVIVTRRSKAYVNGFVYKVILICDRGREYKATNTIRASGSKKINCNFQLEGKYSKEYNHWMLKVICDEHNHPHAQHVEGHPFARRLSADETRLVVDLTRKNVTPRNILSTLQEQNKNNVSVIKTVYNAQQKIHMDSQAGKTPMQVLMSHLHTNNYVYDFTTGAQLYLGVKWLSIRHDLLVCLWLNEDKWLRHDLLVCLGLNEDKWLSIRHDLLEELHSDYSLYHGAFTSGFNELHESLSWKTSPAYEPHYMIMPLTGYLIASKFRVIVHCLSHEQSMTCFPLWKCPEECQPYRTITLVNINGNHYMSVFLKENYSMPLTTPYWNAHRNSSASAWKAMYWSRFELCNQLTARSFVPPWINIDD
ncbi:hypothetical protein LXL04_006729 [Taraxacum kok-saghyz]